MSSLHEALRLGVDQRARQREVREAAQAVEGLVLEHALHLALQLELEVGRDLLSQVLDLARRDAERLRERLVERRDARLGDLLHVERELRLAARDFLAVVVGREGERKRLLLARAHAHHGRLEFGQHAAFAERDRKVARLAAGKLDAVDGAREIDQHAIAGLRRARDGLERGALAAQRLERAVDVRGGDAHHRTVDRDRRQIAHLDLGIHLEHRRELERARIGRRLAGARLDARIARHAQVLAADRVVEARLHGVGDDVGAHLRPVLLRHHLERHLAWPEAGEPHRLGETVEPLLHFAFDVRDGQRDVEAPLERAEVFDRVLHAS
jgi:hypothetical protein